MKYCLGCAHVFASNKIACPLCTLLPCEIEGYPAYSPELALENDGFNPEIFSELAQLEDKNFWFETRNDLISWGLKRYFPSVSSFLEIGCGTGYVLSGIQKNFTNTKVYGSEIFSSALHFANRRIKNANLFQMDARAIPYIEEFDVVGIFDVLEHIREDDIVLAEIHRALKNSGGLLITVPQHNFLWSQQDDYAHHVRRYSKQELISKVRNAGFNVLRCTSFVSFLLPFMIISRLSKRKKIDSSEYDVLSELRLSSFANYVLKKILQFEKCFIKAGLSFPMGGSLFLIAQKEKTC